MHDFAVRLDQARAALNVTEAMPPLTLVDEKYDTSCPFVFPAPIRASVGFETYFTTDMQAQTWTIDTQQVVRGETAALDTTQIWTAPPDLYANFCLWTVCQDRSQGLFYLNDVDECLCKSIIELDVAGADPSRGYQPANQQQPASLCGCQSINPVRNGDIVEWETETRYELFPTSAIVRLTDEANDTKPQTVNEVKVLTGNLCDSAAGEYLAVRFRSKYVSGKLTWVPDRSTRIFDGGAFSWQIGSTQFARIVDQIDAICRASCGPKPGSGNCIRKASRGVGPDFDIISGGGTCINPYCPVIGDDLFWSWWVDNNDPDLESVGGAGADRCPGVILLESQDARGYRGNYLTRYPWLSPTNVKYAAQYDFVRRGSVDGMYCEKSLMLFYMMIAQFDNVIARLGQLAPHKSTCDCPQGYVEIAGAALGVAEDIPNSVYCGGQDANTGQIPDSSVQLDAYHYYADYTDPITGDPISLSHCGSGYVDPDHHGGFLHGVIGFQTSVFVGESTFKINTPGCTFQLGLVDNHTWTATSLQSQYSFWGNGCYNDSVGLHPGNLQPITINLKTAACGPNSYDCTTPPF